MGLKRRKSLAASGSTISLGFASMIRDLNCTTEQAATALRSVKVLICYKNTHFYYTCSLYCLGFGVVPLFTAAFSEEFGRRPLFLVSGVIFALMHLMMALCEKKPILLKLTNSILEHKISQLSLLRDSSLERQAQLGQLWCV